MIEAVLESEGEFDPGAAVSDAILESVLDSGEFSTELLFQREHNAVGVAQVVTIYASVATSGEILAGEGSGIAASGLGGPVGFLFAAGVIVGLNYAMSGNTQPNSTSSSVP